MQSEYSICDPTNYQARLFCTFRHFCIYQPPELVQPDETTPQKSTSGFTSLHSLCFPLQFLFFLIKLVFLRRHYLNADSLVWPTTCLTDIFSFSLLAELLHLAFCGAAGIKENNWFRIDIWGPWMSIQDVTAVHPVVAWCTELTNTAVKKAQPHVTKNNTKLKCKTSKQSFRYVRYCESA